MSVPRRHKGKAKSQPQTGATFLNLSHDLLRQFNSMARQVSHPRRSIVFREGDSPRAVYLVCAGKVKLFAAAGDRRKLLLRIAGPGDMLGLNTLLSNLPYEVSAETLTPCTFKEIDRGPFLDFLSVYPEAAFIAALTLAHESREIFIATRRLALSPSAAARVAQVLIGLMPLDPSFGQLPSFPMMLTHAELASLAGTSRETVARLLNQLERDGIIARDNSTMTIVKLNQLKQLAI